MILHEVHHQNQAEVNLRVVVKKVPKVPQKVSHAQ